MEDDVMILNILTAVLLLALVRVGRVLERGTLITKASPKVLRGFGEAKPPKMVKSARVSPARPSGRRVFGRMMRDLF